MSAPHGGQKVTHHELCLEDCGHSDCMGCCYCPRDEDDVALVAMLTQQAYPEWPALWFSDQIAQAEQRGREYDRWADIRKGGICKCRCYDRGVSAEKDRIRTGVEGVYHDPRNVGWGQMKREVLAVIDPKEGQ